MKAISRSLAAAALCCAAALACSGKDEPGTPEPPVVVLPSAPEVLPLGTVAFTATMDGNPAAVGWSVQEAGGGSITDGGVYTAPASLGTYHVIATSASNADNRGFATVTVTNAPVVQVTVTPRTASVPTGKTATFSATVTGTANTAVSWTVQETGGGAVSSGGLYTAPGSAGTFHVIATSVADASKSDAATVTVTVVQVAVTPKTASVAAGGTVSFSASVTGTTNAAVSWSVQEPAGGTISAGGVYTAPATPGTYHVVATSVADDTRSDTATVTVNGTAGDLASQLALLAGKSIWFGHRSVGGNIMDGVRTLVAANSGAEPTIVTSSNAADMGTGIWAESLNGQNFDPIGKIDAFGATLDAGVGAKVNVAFFKFCWVDFNVETAYFAGGGTVDTLFAAYKAKLDALKAAYPGVTFVHFTAPLVEDTYGDAPMNPRREAYSNLVRQAYQGKEPLLDLALLESTDPNGARVSGTYGYALYHGYSSDGGHLNATGEDKVARALIALLAGL